MAIDREKIIDEMSKVQVCANEEGLIPAFGVYIQLLPANLWNAFSRRLVNAVSDEVVPAVEVMLVNAAHECGYHTGHGIITSKEWEQIVGPMIENPGEDTLHGAFAVFTAWGWAQVEVVELVPGERMLIRAKDYYERDFIQHGTTARPAAYMIRGVCAGFMDLAYGGPYDATGKTGLRTYTCEQTKGIETGDAVGEFVVTKATDSR